MDSTIFIPAFLSVMGFGLVIVAGMFTAAPYTVPILSSSIPMSSSSSIPTKEKQHKNGTERYHVSKVKIDRIRSVDPGFKFTHKPTGLWYAFTKTRWIEWARSTFGAFKKNEVVYLYRLKFTKPSNILIVDTLQKAKDLCKQLVSSTARSYNWNKIKQQGFDGVEIYDDVVDSIFKTTDRGDCLLMLQYFDISSGCLWNVDNVQVELIETIKIK